MKNPWFPLYDGDLLANTMHLTHAEFGCYMRLIIHAYNHHGEIPSADRRLAHIAGCDPRLWWQYKETVLQFFDTVDASTMQHKRVVTELARSHEISNKRKAAALQMHSKRTARAHANGGVITTQHNTTPLPPSAQQHEPPPAVAPSNGSGGGGSPTVEMPILSYREEQRLLEAYRKQRKAEEQAKHS